jgi:hypothetical protein
MGLVKLCCKSLEQTLSGLEFDPRIAISGAGA